MNRLPVAENQPPYVLVARAGRKTSSSWQFAISELKLMRNIVMPYTLPSSKSFHFKRKEATFRLNFEMAHYHLSLREHRRYLQ